jgi:uncharacterized repeat protein (TIGR01451 family)
MKISQRTTPTQATAALAVGLIAIPAVMAASHPAASHTASAARAPRVPEVTVNISDGHVAARAGDELTYTVSLSNSGAVAVPRLKVTQTLSTGLEFLSASDHGVAANGYVSWSAGLPVGGKRTFDVVTRVTRTPTTLLRLAAVACVTLPGSSRPIVCAAHLDRLPAAAASASRSGHSVGDVLTYIMGGLAVLVLGLLTVIVARRRGQLRRQPALPPVRTAKPTRPVRSGRSLTTTVLQRIASHDDHEDADRAASGRPGNRLCERRRVPAADRGRGNPAHHHRPPPRKADSR